jgi:hypothetical protein
MIHRCPRQPKNITVEHDVAFGWAVISQQGIIEIQWCPWCGKELKEPTVTHIEMLCNLVDVRGAPMLVKGNTYEVALATDSEYKVYDENNGICVVPKSQRGILYKCKEVTM